MLVCDTHAEAQVALAVGAFDLESDRLFAVADEKYVGIKFCIVVVGGDWLQLYVDGAYYAELRHVFVGAVHHRRVVS